MNAMLPPRFAIWLTLIILGLAYLPMFAGSAFGAESGTHLQANFMLGLVADRARMIQVTLVVVATGCALIWWYR
jgi:TRAP-type C4-dicarboxylate transport system permease small subunit